MTLFRVTMPVTPTADHPLAGTWTKGILTLWFLGSSDAPAEFDEAGLKAREVAWILGYQPSAEPAVMVDPPGCKPLWLLEGEATAKATGMAIRFEATADADVDVLLK